MYEAAEPVYIYDANANENYYLLKNDQNTVLALYQASDTTGSVPREQYEYSSYGITNILDQNGLVKTFDHDLNVNTPEVKKVKSDFSNPFGYQGMWRDEHTGLYHTHYRLYDPQHVRWLTPDPAGYRDGQNLYRFYAGPNGVDVLGLSKTSFINSLRKYFKYGKDVSPDDIMRKLLGKLPKNWHLRGQSVLIGDARIKNPTWKAISSKYKGLTVHFSEKAIPDFREFLMQVQVKIGDKVANIGAEVQIVLKGNRGLDEKLAIQELEKLTGKKWNEIEKAGYVWHHGEIDEVTGKVTMQYVPKEVNDAVGHYGGHKYAEALNKLNLLGEGWLACAVMEIAPNSVDAAAKDLGEVDKARAGARDVVATLTVENPWTTGCEIFYGYNKYALKMGQYIPMPAKLKMSDEKRNELINRIEKQKNAAIKLNKNPWRFIREDPKMEFHYEDEDDEE